MQELFRFGRAIYAESDFQLRFLAGWLSASPSLSRHADPGRFIRTQFDRYG
jgi:hypothetical protein